MAKQSFAAQYPHIARWVDDHQGWIEIGYSPDGPLTSFVRALDMGGMPWEGKDEYESLDEAFHDLDVNIGAYLQELYGSEL